MRSRVRTHVYVEMSRMSSNQVEDALVFFCRDAATQQLNSGYLIRSKGFHPN